MKYNIIPPERFLKLKLGMVQFRAIRMSTKDFGMDFGGRRKINCVPENELISLTASDNENFISVGYKYK